MNPFTIRKQPPRTKKISNNTNVNNTTLNNKTTNTKENTTKETFNVVTRRKTRSIVETQLTQPKTNPASNQKSNSKVVPEQKTISKVHSNNNPNTKIDKLKKSSIKSDSKQNTNIKTGVNTKNSSNETPENFNSNNKNKVSVPEPLNSLVHLKKDHNKSNFSETSNNKKSTDDQLTHDAPKHLDSDRTYSDVPSPKPNQHHNCASSIVEDTDKASNTMTLTTPYQPMTSQDWYNMRNGFLDKICSQERDIINLKNQIKNLESIIQDMNTNPEKIKLSTNDNTYVKEHEYGLNCKTPITSCFIIGDSHVRGLCSNVSQLMPNSCKVEAFFQPGGGFSDMAKTHEQSKNLIAVENLDSVVVMCGTNDVFATPWETIKRALDSLTAKFDNCKRFCLVGIPQRFDISKINFHIHRLNMKIRNYLKSTLKNDKFWYIDPTRFLKYKDYTYDKMHLNKIGKEKLSRQIKKTLDRSFSFKRSDFIQAHMSADQQSHSDIKILESKSNTPKPNLCNIPSSTPSYAQTLVSNLRPQYPTMNSGLNYTHGNSPTNLSIPSRDSLNSSYSQNYLRLTQNINMSTLSNNSTFNFQTPIPRLNPGYNRANSNQNVNFPLKGQTPTT